MTNDIIIHALLANDSVQVCAINGKQLVEKAREIHGLSRVATAALGRQLLMTAMMGSRLKNDTDRISTIIKGNGCAGSMVCTSLPGGIVKGCTQETEAELPPTPEGKLDVGGYVGHEGKLTVVRDSGSGEPYIGVCNLISGEIAMDFAQYFTVSEQQPSLVYLGVRVDIETGEVKSAGGILIQPLPGCDDAVIDRLTEKASDISTLTARLETADLKTCLNSVLGSFGLSFVSEHTPLYRCDCSRERIEKALISVGEKDLLAMIEQDHGAEVNCQFCGKQYHFNEDELRLMLAVAKEKAKND